MRCLAVAVLLLGSGIALPAALVFGCSKNNTIDASTHNTTINNVTQVIGPDGGYVESPGGAAVSIPPGALTKDVTITIGESVEGVAPALPPGTTPLSPVFAFEPHGLVFSALVTIRIPHSAGGDGSAAGLWRADPGGAWAMPAVIERRSTSVVTQAMTFSFYVSTKVDPTDAAVGDAPEEPAVDAPEEPAPDAAGDGPPDGTPGCSGQTSAAEMLPLAMYLALDHSAGAAGTPWAAARNGVFDFVNDAAAAGTSVGVLGFPGTSGICDGAAYAAPSVAIAQIPGVVAPIQSWGSAQSASGARPLEDVVRGMASYADGWVSMHPQETLVLVILAAGLPDTCQTDLPTIAALLTGKPYNTWVLDTAATPSGISALAVGGALRLTPAATDVTGELKTILQSEQDCHYRIPVGATDPSKVNVKVGLAGNAASVVPNAGDSASCGSDDGWYYDNPGNPMAIHLCMSTCAKVAGDNTSTVEIEVGCEAVLK